MSLDVVLNIELVEEVKSLRNYFHPVNLRLRPRGPASQATRGSGTAIAAHANACPLKFVSILRELPHIMADNIQQIGDCDYIKAAIGSGVQRLLSPTFDYHLQLRRLL